MDLNSAKRQAGREKEMKVSKGEKREREREETHERCQDVGLSKRS